MKEAALGRLLDEALASLRAHDGDEEPGPFELPRGVCIFANLGRRWFMTSHGCALLT